MMPPMRQSVTISKTMTDSLGNPIYDKFGKPKTVFVLSKARVRSRSSLIAKADGSEVNANIEIDVPPDIIINDGERVEYTRIDGRTGSGTVIQSEETTNVTASRVLFRTVFVDGR